MGEQGEEAIQPDAILTAEPVSGGQIGITIHPIDENGNVGEPLTQKVTTQYDKEAKLVVKAVPDKNVNVTGNNVTTNKA